MSGVKYLKWITRDMLRAEPAALFVFGDNAERWGLGGQAKEMRGELNAFGVATLWAPGRFYTDNDPQALRVVMNDLKNLSDLVPHKTTYVPFDGLGTGLAQLATRAPSLANLITAFFNACPGEPCPWEFV